MYKQAEKKNKKIFTREAENSTGCRINSRASFTRGRGTASLIPERQNIGRLIFSLLNATSFREPIQSQISSDWTLWVFFLIAAGNHLNRIGLISKVRKLSELTDVSSEASL